MKLSTTIFNQVKIFIFFVFILSASQAFTKSFPLEKRFYCFDAGTADSPVRQGAILLAPGDIYQKNRNFGWLATPDHSFIRSELERSRTPLTIDGVIGKRISFRADLPPGKWWITLWIEAGIEDSSTVSFSINNEKIELGWHPFLPPAEGRTDIQNIYRLYHGRTVVQDNGLQFQFIGGRDSVRLLGFTMTPDPTPAKQIHNKMIRRFKKAGRFGSTMSLDSLRLDLKKILKHDPTDVFAAYWSEQIQLLSLAEQYKSMMGWEWAKKEVGMGIFDRYHQAVMILDGLLNRPEGENYFFYERALWQRGRLLYWLGEERHGKNEIEGGRRDLAALYRRHPDNPLLAMYNGEKIDQPDPCDQLETTSDAPPWSIAQREALCRLRRIAHWWVQEQQAPNGEFGGKVDDDVEMLRWWTTLILAGDTTAFHGWRLLADCVWNSPDVYKGYSLQARDVEHASEYIADTAPAMILYSDDSIYLDRLLPSVHYFDTLWTGITPAGHRFFRSTWFGSREVRTEIPKNRDHEYNTRAVKASRYLAWKTRDPAIIRLLHEWSLAWANAAMRTDKDKPKGIIPASIRFPDEAINADEPTWYKANMYWDYYDWESHVGSMMLDQLLFTYTLTGDTLLLQPLFAALELVESYNSSQLLKKEPASMIPGSPEWTAVKLRENETFWSVVAQWRLITGDSSYDDLISRYGSPYLRYRLTGNEQYLLEGLQVLLESIRYNEPLLTSEVLHTDRIYVLGAHHLKAMLTGDGISESMSPNFAVSWEGPDENFTALVTEAGSDNLGVEIYSHSKKDYRISMRLWQLEPGTYQIKCQSKKGIEESTFEMQAKGQRIPLVLPEIALLRINIEKVQ